MLQLMLAGLAALFPKIVWSILKALGIGVLTFAAATLAVNAISDLIQARIGGLVGDVYQILALGGVITGLNIVLGAYAAAATIKATKSTLGYVGGLEGAGS